MLLKDQMEKQGVWLFRFRGILPLIILVFGVCVYINTELHPERYLLEETGWEIYYDMLCLAVSLLGLAVRIITVGHTPAKTSGRNVTEQVADTLNTTGMYSIVRNPLYLGNFLMWLGIGMLTMNLWFIVAFVLFYWIYYERIIYAEEQFLTRKFGGEYEVWAAETPCFIPRFTGYRKASVPFSWKKVIKKEKNGLLALLLIFTLFEIGGELLQGGILTGEWPKGELPKYMPMAYVTGGVLVAYLIIKIIKTNTKLLNEEGR